MTSYRRRIRSPKEKSLPTSSLKIDGGNILLKERGAMDNLGNMKTALAILAFVFVVYANTLSHPFFFDDSHYIQSNVAIQTPSNLLNIWTSAIYNSSSPDQWGYRPFTTFIHSLSWLAGGGATWPFHVVKCVLHALVCLLLFLVWKRVWSFPGFFPKNAPALRFKWRKRDVTWSVTPASAALVLSFVFAAHPANTQVLNYISATTTLLAGTCYLAAYYFYLRFREDSRLKFFLGSLALYALAVFAKEEGITLIGVIILSELLLPRRAQNRFSVVGYFFVGLMMALLLKTMFAESSSAARGTETRIDYFMTQWRAYLYYMKLLVWPWSLNADNLEFGFSRSFWDAKVLSALVGNLLLVIFAWLQRARYPVFLFSLFWFYIAVSPASSVIPLAEPVNDHRMYIAYFGLVGIFPWILKGISAVSRRTDSESLSPISGVIAAMAFIALIIGTEVRNQVWTDPETLWTDTVNKNPYSPRAHNNLALSSMSRGDWNRSRELLNRCEELSPSYIVCKVNSALVLVSLGQDTEADQKFRDAIAIDPRSPETKMFYASFLVQRGRTEGAYQIYKEVDGITLGQDLQAKLGWARSARMLGHEEEAKSVLVEAKKRFGERPEITALLAEGVR